MLIDSHCHLSLDAFNADRPAVLARARAAGVRAVIDVGTEPGGWERTLSLASQEPDVWAALGLHPNEVADAPASAMARLAELLPTARVVAIGETGLDYHWQRTPSDQQQAVLLAHLDLARQFHLPVIIHCRDAYADLLAVLARHGSGTRGVLHCFGGTVEQARQALDIGYVISVGGPVTFRNSGAVREVVADVPAGSLLLETDAPYLTPHPHRGRRNEPAQIAAIVQAVAAARGEDPTTTAAHTSAAAARLFRLTVPT